MYVMDAPASFHRVELVLYADGTAVIATSRHQELFFKYMEPYLSDLERWLKEWMIAINVSMSNALLFAKSGGRIPTPRPVQLFVEPIQWVDTARCLRVSLDTRLTWPTHIDQVRKKAVQRLGMF